MTMNANASIDDIDDFDDLAVSLSDSNLYSD